MHPPQHGTDMPFGSRSGQTLIFLVMSVVILAFVALWNFDLHKTVFVKSIAQNGGDAAALAAARWQAQTLNLIGDLNIVQAVAWTEGDQASAQEIAEIQARLCYVGPMIGFLAAQQAAKNNGLFANDKYTARVRSHAQNVRNSYTSLGGDGQMLFEEPYAGCWQEYADMIETVADNGIAAGPDNARFYTDYSGSHLLLDPGFYDAVAGENWCWFLHHAYELLLNYDNYFWWPQLPDRLSATRPVNCEYFGLGLRKTEWSGDATVVKWMNEIGMERNLRPVPIEKASLSVTSSWYSYDPDLWGPWSAISPAGEWPFPATGTVKSQYDYMGADAAVRVEATASRLTPRSGASHIVWSAAAKPFGFLGEDQAPMSAGLVLPAFRSVRLIPIDASSAPGAGAFNLYWRDHIEAHLPVYMKQGPSAIPSDQCGYCAQLVTWENALFRQRGISWLREYSDTCQVEGGPGGGAGGTRRGH